MRLWWVSVLAIGCGRIGFDAPGDVRASDGDGPSGAEAGGGAPIALVQHISDTGGSTTVDAATFAEDVTVGNVIVVAWDNDANAVDGATVTDSLGNAYAIVAGPSGTPQLFETIAAAVVTVGGTDTVTVTRATSSMLLFEVRLHEFSGLAAPVAIPHAFAEGTTTAVDAAKSPPIATTRPAILFGFGTYVFNSDPGTGFTPCEQDFGDLTEYEVVPSPGTYTATSTSTGASGAWLMMGAAFPTL